MGRQALRPELERLPRTNPKRDPVDHSRPSPPAREAGIFKKRKVGARAAVLVRVEEVIDRRIVLVDGLLDQAQTHHACVEENVARRVGRDRADVVDAVEILHVECSNPGAGGICSSPLYRSI